MPALIEAVFMQSGSILMKDGLTSMILRGDGDNQGCTVGKLRTNSYKKQTFINIPFTQVKHVYMRAHPTLTYSIYI